MQPRRPRRRPIQRELRPDGPLVYERLSDPILVRRAKDGDRRAPAALCVVSTARGAERAAPLLPVAETARARAQGAVRLRLRGDLVGDGLSGRDGEVLRPPRAQRAAGAALGMTVQPKVGL